MAFSFKLRRQLTNSSIKSIPRDSVEYYTLVEVQERLLKLYEDDKDLFDETDVKKIIQSMGYLRRYAQRRDGNPDKTVEMVKNTLIWRKEQRLAHICDKYIPMEFYDYGICFPKGRDIDGNYVLHVRGKYGVVTDKVKVGIERIIAYQMFKACEESMSLPSGKGWVFCCDLTGISMAQYDLPEVLWAINVIVSYMPSSLKSIIAYNLPWFAKPFVKIVMTFIPSEWKRIIHFVSHKELLKMIPADQLPKYIENPKEKPGSGASPPPETVSVDEIDTTELGIKREDFADFFHNTLAKIK